MSDSSMGMRDQCEPMTSWHALLIVSAFFSGTEILADSKFHWKPRWISDCVGSSCDLSGFTTTPSLMQRLTKVIVSASTCSGVEANSSQLSIYWKIADSWFLRMWILMQVISSVNTWGIGLRTNGQNVYLYFTLATSNAKSWWKCACMGTWWYA